MIKKARELQKNLYFCLIDYAKAFDCVDHKKLENSESDGNTRPPYLPPETSVQVKKQQLEPDMEQQTGSSSDCRHEIKRCFLLGRKAMTKLDSILKSRDITLTTKFCLV